MNVLMSEEWRIEIPCIDVCAVVNIIRLPVIIFVILPAILFLAGCQTNAPLTPTLPPPVTSLPIPTPTPMTTPSSAWPSSVSAWVSVGKDFVTGLAIIVGGWWSYNKFIKRREKYPRSKITHSIMHISLTNDKVLLHITVNISNEGDVLLSLKSAETWIQQVLPLSGETGKLVKSGNDPVLKERREIEWPLLRSRDALSSEGLQIEPGESDWLAYDFVIDKQIEFVRIYSYFKNISQHGREIGWSLENLYDLRSLQIASKKVI